MMSELDGILDMKVLIGLEAAPSPGVRWQNERPSR